MFQSIVAVTQYLDPSHAPKTRTERAPLLCVGLTLLLCALVQLLAAASKACADCHEARRLSRTPGAGTRGVERWSGAGRCRWPLLSLRGRDERLRLDAAFDADALAAEDAHAIASAPSFETRRTPRALGPSNALVREHDDSRDSPVFLERRTLVANSFLVVGGSALSAGLIAAGLAYRTYYGQKDPLARDDVERANTELQRVQRTGTVATSLLGAGGAVFLSGIALKLWNRSARASRTGFQGKLVAKPSKSGAILAVRGTWGVAL